MTAQRRASPWRAAPLAAVATGVVLALAAAQERPANPLGCTMSGCHEDMKRASHLHGPVAFDACSACHREIEGDHDFRLARPPADLCSTCHPEIDRTKHLHEDLSPAGCTLCHDPHGSEHAFLLPTADVSALCLQCHRDLLEARDLLHTPLAARGCTACHDPHVATSRSAPEDRAAACLACHGELEAALAAGTPHAPLLEGTCDRCHDPHGSGHGANLVDDVPSLCLPCHEETRSHVAAAPVGHAPASEPDGCTRCHDPHVSPYAGLLRAAPAQLCGTCHDETVRAGDRAVEAVTRTIAESQFLHGPVQQRDCSACHDPHGSDHPGLLVARYTPEFYAAFDLAEYDLCFTCHDERIALEERTAEITGFRDGDRNLHYAHVNLPDRGRTCRACHATHGSDLPHHVREAVPYGTWELPVGYEKTDTGGRCSSGCHVERAYDRVTPVARSGDADDDAQAPPDPAGADGGLP